MKVAYKQQPICKEELIFKLPEAFYAEVAFTADLTILHINTPMRAILGVDYAQNASLTELLPVLNQVANQMGKQFKIVIVLSSQCPVQKIYNCITKINPTIVVDPTGIIKGGTLLVRGLN